MIWKRIVAAVIDWNLCGMPALIYSFIFRAVVRSHGISLVIGVLFFFFVLSFFVLFVFRNVIFGGRSIGKRLLGLYIVDKKTNELPSKQKLVIRNLFLFIYPIDAIFLIVNKQSIGDMATETAVICK